MTFALIKNWLLTWLEVAGHWQNLRRYFKPIVVRTFITWFAVAPIALKVMEGLPETIPVPLGERSYHLTLALPFSWYLLWIASLAYFLAYVLYIGTCPRFVREFPDFSEFLRQSHSPRFLVWELSRVWRNGYDRERIAKRLIEKGLAVKVEGPVPDDNPRVSARGTVFVFEWKGTLFETIAHEDDTENRQRELFWETFSPAARYAPGRRNLTWLLLTVSFLLVAIVVIQQIWFVLRILMAS